ncbi:hypothetical protein ACHAW5_010330 [Stephanodiscus triporus]|uniref:Uncharacterized protein n=1 Tax=Stephanodiscus triporus TaxID=2934178 RepID=A0ABD3NGS5_9STRA
MSTALPQKRAERRSGTTSEVKSGAAATSTRYDRLLSILSKALTRSRDEIASDASHTIEECYGEMTSLFTSSDDGDGVARLVDILLGKLDGAHDRLGPDLRRSSSSSSSSASTQLEKLLERRGIRRSLRRIEDAIDAVEAEEREFEEADAADRVSAKDAIRMARSSSRASPTSGKRRRLLPAECIAMRAYGMKLEYQRSLESELEGVEGENARLERELEDGWGEWQRIVEEVKGALDVMEKLGEVDDSAGDVVQK